LKHPLVFEGMQMFPSQDEGEGQLVELHEELAHAWACASFVISLAMNAVRTTLPN